MDNRSISGTIISTVVRKNQILKKNIIDELKKAVNPISTSDLSSKLGKAWHTIDRNCLMLQIEGKVEGFKVGKMNLWRIK